MSLTLFVLLVKSCLEPECVWHIMKSLGECVIEEISKDIGLNIVDDALSNIIHGIGSVTSLAIGPKLKMRVMKCTIKKVSLLPLKKEECGKGCICKVFCEEKSGFCSFCNSYFGSDNSAANPIENNFPETTPENMMTAPPENVEGR